MTDIQVIQGDITKCEVGAIVNAANTSLLGGGGVDGAIHRAAGGELLEECRALQGCKVGEAKITKGYNLPADFVIHTVGPVWKGGGQKEEDLLRNCYQNSLNLALENSIKSIAFPCISTGVYRFPKKQAAQLAYQTVVQWSCENSGVDVIIFVCYSEQDKNYYLDLISQNG